MATTIEAPKTLEQLHVQVAAINGELTKLKPTLDNEQRSLGAATQAYNEACRDLARGKDADPATFKAEMDRRSEKIQGLKSIISDLEKQHDQLTPRQRELELKVTLLQEAAELVRLKAVQLEKQTVLEAAQKALDLAQGARNGANFAVDHFRRQCELRQQRRANGLE